MISETVKISETPLQEMLREALECDLREEEKTQEAAHRNISSFLLYRKGYVEHAKQLGAMPPTMERAIDITGQRLKNFIDSHDVKTLIVGASGDLDSSFTLMLLGRAIQKYRLSCTIQAFYLKNNFHAQRARRVEKLVRYLKTTGCKIDLKVFDMAVPFDLLQLAVTRATEGKIRPPSQNYIDEMRRVFENAIARICTFASHVDAPATQAAEEPKILDARERSNLIHELIITLRGHLCRETAEPAVIVPTTASEFLLGNFTTSDVFGAFAPLIYFPKSAVAAMFREAIISAPQDLKLEHWKYSLTTQVPYYPDKIRIRKSLNGRICFDRDAENISTCSTAECNKSTSHLTDDTIDGFRMTPEGYARIPGEIQFTFDRFLHHFMFGGCSEQTIDELCELDPHQASDVKLTAFLLTAAREKVLKDAYVVRTVS